MKLYNLIPSLKEKKQHAHDEFAQNQIKARELVLKAQEEAIQIKQKAEDQARAVTTEIVELEKKLRSKEQSLDSQTASNTAEKNRRCV